ncbi:BatA domain-containing protein [Methanolobus chelungpuianus]|uniref:N-terminal double-transmembrane domain-containing protein n=1 Tax=Methanolobus chelungpuianus TaxID=502115 RepID=A0AAE3L2J8_9EURY|nr:BatA domain-containing protein [Methanolobus chelungpuianus]MCQ6963623.1 N-terminal double-transmembrane domain-containing protein [Methanolobus chelungpuianus]
MPFETPLALAALASVIPLILLYLLRPKPLQVVVPSLMFLMNIKEEKKRFYTSITKLIKDPLFLIQLLVLILLALAAAAPFIETQEPLSGEHTVIIIDASASMQTDNRFSDALSKAGDYVSKKNTIILAENVPVTVLADGGSSAADETLNTLKPKAVVADISAAVSAGMRTLSQEGGRIVVISDFSYWDGDDPVNAKNLAESYGLQVEYVLVGSSTDNVGIIQGEVSAVDGSYTYAGIVKNYNNGRQSVRLDVVNEDGSSQQVNLNVAARSTQQFKVTNLKPGISEVRIAAADSLMVDNVAYISVPPSASKQMLVVSDTGKLPSHTALSLMPNVRTNLLEGVPSDLSRYSVVVVATKQRALASNEIATLNSFIRSGGEVVFIASDALASDKAGTDMQELLPVRTGDVVSAERGVTLKVLQETRLSEDIQFKEVAVYEYLNATARRDTTTLVSTTAGTPMLVYGTLGDGTVVYLGLNDAMGEDAWNNFHNLPEYPVFWFKLAGWLGGTGSVTDYNLKTGSVSALAREQEIQTPSGLETTSRVLYDEAGVYTVVGKRIAVNLYSDRESDTTLTGQELIDRSKAKDSPGIVRASSYTAKNYLDTYMIIIVFLLVLLELLIIRKRGEL